MKYIAIWHANLNYAYLTPDKYEFVIRESYELLFDTMRENFPGVKYVFEASGFTIEQMAEITPGVLEKLKHAMAKGECEFMGSPYAHPMLPNFPKRDGVWSVRFSNEVYEKHLGMRPVSFWNPECGWAAHVPEIVAETGYRNLIGDFEAYSRSKGLDGRPLRPEIYDLEHTDEVKFYNFGYKFDMPGDERAIHFPFKNLEGLPPDTLRSFLRTDRICQPTERYFMGKPGYDLEHCMELIRKYSAQKPGEPEGALIIYADDVEYVGTNGWYRLKYENKPDNTFERVPESRDRLIALVSETLKLGAFITYDEGCRDLPALEEPLNFDHDSAWHGARASTWAGTPMAKQLRPWQDLVREKLSAAESSMDPGMAKRAWYHLTNSYNSDGQWPPTLPDAPHIVHPFDYEYCHDNLVKAEALVGGVDRAKLTVEPAATLHAILRYQQDLIEKKARAILDGKEQGDAAAAREALELIAVSRDLTTVRGEGTKTLDPVEYLVRADFMVAARRLVGGVRLEDVDESEKGKKV
jgi:hypothetical protein